MGMLKAILHSPFLMLMSVMVDVLLILMVGFSIGNTFMSTSEELQILHTEISKQAIEGNSISVEAVKSQYNAVLAGIVLILLTLWLAWGVTQGANWWAAQEILGVKTNALKVIMRSLILTLAWTVLAVLILAGTSLLERTSLALFGSLTRYASMFMILLMGYFAQASYAKTSGKLSFKGISQLCFSKWKSYLPAYLACVFGSILLMSLAAYLSSVLAIMGLLVVLFLLLYVAICRVWISSIANGHKR